MNQIFATSKSLLQPFQSLTQSIRHASKKASGSTRNSPGHARPKHRGWRRQDNSWVLEGTILAAQRTMNWHPGLNVAVGRDGTLTAMLPGRVVITCEKINPDWDNHWIKRCYAGREGYAIYRKHFNVIPLPQHQRFKMIDEI